MPNPKGRPKGPKKVRLTVTILASTHEWLKSKAARHEKSPATYIGWQLDKQAEEAGE